MSKLSASISVSPDRISRLAAVSAFSALAMWLTGTAALAQPAPTPAIGAEAKQTQKVQAAKERERLHKSWEAERKEIQGKREVIERQRVDAEKLCYQKFAVEGCLAEARTEAREKDAPLRARELEINAVERKEKAAERLKAIEEKKAENAAVPMKAQQREKESTKASGPKGPGAKPGVDEEAAHAQRQSEAQQRATRQSDYVRRHEQNRAHADEGRSEREAKARAEFEAKQKEAAAHKASVLKKAQEGEQKKAAPLPPPAP
ncbi:MAG: hypothetical protein LBJ15_06865 [Comamonas sp.]|jgi:hypothetical protein|uniref:hypothetical protein n=1 Tax=Comamonas sp. TaxID=34028 RepID=UPI002838DD0A|nr:hypothetical protein [Comamonas sp.]MDR0213712.1 hypothetical protein [Comamonas sp.]